MTDKPQVKLSLDEDLAIVMRLDAIAETEGTSRAALIRRAIRQLVFSMPTVPTFGKSPESEPTEAAA